MTPSPESHTLLLIDTDGGVDDAMAIMMALAHPSAQVLGITAVNGNVQVDQALTNVALTLEALGARTPIYRGCDRPLLGEVLRPGPIMGEDGLGGATLEMPPPKLSPQGEHAAQALIRLAAEGQRELTLLALGPLTNVALALRLDPTFASRIARLVIMGGAVEARGNASPAAEFNVLADPEAAAIVLQASFPETWLLPWETTLTHPLPWQDYEALIGGASAGAQFLRRISEHTARVLRETFRTPGFLVPDPLAAAVALAPDCVEEAPSVPLWVEVSGKHGRGLTSVDWLGQFSDQPAARVVLALDDRRVLALLQACVE
jgi:purine nucleosidase